MSAHLCVRVWACGVRVCVCVCVCVCVRTRARTHTHTHTHTHTFGPHQVPVYLLTLGRSLSLFTSWADLIDSCASKAKRACVCVCVCVCARNQEPAPPVLPTCVRHGQWERGDQSSLHTPTLRSRDSARWAPAESASTSSLQSRAAGLCC